MFQSLLLHVLLLKRICLNSKQEAGFLKAQQTGSISNNASKKSGPTGGTDCLRGRLGHCFKFLCTADSYM